MAEPSQSPSGPVSLPPHGVVTPSSSPMGTPADVPAAKWDAIAHDLADRGVTGTPTLVSSEAVTWNNGALGCPQPGGTYTQALINGMRVVVSVDGKTYDYRFGAGDAAKLCVPGVHG